MEHKTLISRRPVSDRMRGITRVLWVVFSLNLAVALAKFIYGVVSQSASMQADGIHSIFDSAGNIVGLVGITLASRPADTGHPYGHSKFETYASLIIGIFLLVAAFEVGSSAVFKLISGDFTVEVTPISFVVMVGTLAINLLVTRYERACGTRLRSDILLADASHTLSDAFVSLGVIIGLGLVALGFPEADAVMALIVTVAILYTAWDVFRRGLATLSDKARIPEREIFDCVKQLSEVQGCHQIRTRGTTNEVYVDMHVVVDPNITVLQAHDLCDRIEELLRADFPGIAEVLVHIEPDDGSHALNPDDLPKQG